MRSSMLALIGFLEGHLKLRLDSSEEQASLTYTCIKLRMPFIKMRAAVISAECNRANLRAYKY